MWYKVDLHIHTPASSCYIDNLMPAPGLDTTPAVIINNARLAGLDAIAITDHNTIRGIASILKAGVEMGLYVFPGIEFSARGGHIIALWDAGVSLDHLQELVSRLGFNGVNEGQGYYESELPIYEIIDQVHIASGLVIAAHIDRRPKGFIVSDELSLTEKQQVYQHPYLQALEITIEKDKRNWNGGLIGSFPDGKPCIQGSDAHAPAEIGRRFVYLELPELTLSSLALAFKEFHKRILFPEEFEKTNKGT